MPGRGWILTAGFAALLSMACGPSMAGPPEARQQDLIRMVRQDCGSCHGMRLTGGLGPALTREALADKPLDSLAATVYSGRPGTPMPPWSAMLSMDEAVWIVQQLQSGFPQEAQRNR